VREDPRVLRWIYELAITNFTWDNALMTNLTQTTLSSLTCLQELHLIGFFTDSLPLSLRTLHVRNFSGTMDLRRNTNLQHLRLLDVQLSILGQEEKSETSFFPSCLQKLALYHESDIPRNLSFQLTHLTCDLDVFESSGLLHFPKLEKLNLYVEDRNQEINVFNATMPILKSCTIRTRRCSPFFLPRFIPLPPIQKIKIVFLGVPPSVFHLTYPVTLLQQLYVEATRHGRSQMDITQPFPSLEQLELINIGLSLVESNVWKHYLPQLKLVSGFNAFLFTQRNEGERAFHCTFSPGVHVVE
jgi:hypothetical protein